MHIQKSHATPMGTININNLRDSASDTLRGMHNSSWTCAECGPYKNTTVSQAKGGAGNRNTNISCGFNSRRCNCKTGNLSPDTYSLHSKAYTQEASIQPLDGGWGWCIVLAGLLVYSLVGSMWRIYGVIYIQLRDRFNSSAAITSWLGGVSSAMLIVTPIATGLGTLTSTRTVTLIGAILASLGFFISGFATGPWYMLFSYSLLAGFGGALAYIPAMVLVAKYFEKRRGIATGIASAGTGLGTFLLTPLSEWFFRTNGWFGGMLMMSGVMLHISIAASLQRPLEDNYPKSNTLIDEYTKLNHRNGHVNHENGNIEKECPTHEEENCKELSPNKAVYEKDKAPIQETQKELISQRRQFSISKSKTLHSYLKLCQDLRFLVFSITLAMITMSYMAAPMILPDHVRTHGVADDKAVLLLSVLGIGEMVSRVLAGMFFDINVIRKHRKHWYGSSYLLQQF